MCLCLKCTRLDSTRTPAKVASAHTLRLQCPLIPLPIHTLRLAQPSASSPLSLSLSHLPDTPIRLRSLIVLAFAALQCKCRGNSAACWISLAQCPVSLSPWTGEHKTILITLVLYALPPPAHYTYMPYLPPAAAGCPRLSCFLPCFLRLVFYHLFVKVRHMPVHLLGFLFFFPAGALIPILALRGLDTVAKQGSLIVLWESGQLQLDDERGLPPSGSLSLLSMGYFQGLNRVLLHTRRKPT